MLLASADEGTVAADGLAETGWVLVMAPAGLVRTR